MKNALRFVLLGCSCLAALAVAGSAMAAYQPRLIVKNPTDQPGAAASLTLRVEQPKEDDATFRVTIYVPRAYATSLVPQEGATIGSAEAQVQANQISADTIVPVTGSIKGDPTFTAAEYDTAGLCLTGTGITEPDAVYRLELSAAGQTLPVIPMYVEPITAGPLASAFSAQVVACLRTPYVAPPEGAALGAKLINADLTLNGLFTNPATADDYRWSAVWTPFTVGTGTPNAAGTVETQSVDRLAAKRLSLNARTSGRTVTLSGSLLEGARGVVAARVQLQIGRTAARLRAAVSATTRASGSFSAASRNRAPGVWFARARVTVADRATPCVPLFAPIPCIAANVPGFTNFTSRVVRFRIR